MTVIRNFLAIIGFFSLLAIGYMLLSIMPYYQQVKLFDEKARDTYTELALKVLETGNAAEATVWKMKVNDGLSVEDVEDTMKIVANELNISHVGQDLPLSKDVESKTGKPHRFVKIYMFCNSLTAAKMLEYNDAYSAYLPCRISLIEDKQKQLWLYSLNMDLMIYGGKPLPPKLKDEALYVRKVILDIMRRGSEGEF